MEERNETFNYTYSAEEQQEIRQIREKYAPTAKEESPMDRLRRLDQSVTKTPAILSLIVGILSSLILGVGMCCIMVWDGLLPLGVAVGVIGILGVIAAYPLYTHLVRRRRAKLAPEILRLSGELIR